MKQYLDQLREIIDHGETRTDRTGVGTRSIFGMQTRYDLREGFPLLTNRKMNFSTIPKELCWFLRAETNIKTLGCKIWNEWSRPDGELGPIYGAQWRDWQGVSSDEEDNRRYSFDQIEDLINRLKIDPWSRRHVVSAWNVAQVYEMVLSPCHTMFQCYASKIPVCISMIGDPDPKDFYYNETRKFYLPRRPEGAPEYFLDLQLYQRSGDMLLGVPTNIASYSLLLMLLAREVNMIPRFFIHTLGDAHVYLNHLEGAQELLRREPLPLPRVEIANKPLPFPGGLRDGSMLEPEDFKLVGYESHAPIKFEIAV